MPGPSEAVRHFEIGATLTGAQLSQTFPAGPSKAHPERRLEERYRIAAAPVAIAHSCEQRRSCWNPIAPCWIPIRL